MKREFETRYWQDNRHKAPMTRGFPKAEAGSAEGAGKVIMKGLTTKEEAVSAMESGSLFGWHVPGADPEFTARVALENTKDAEPYTAKEQA